MNTQFIYSSCLNVDYIYCSHYVLPLLVFWFVYCIFFNDEIKVFVLEMSPCICSYMVLRTWHNWAFKSYFHTSLQCSTHVKCLSSGVRGVWNFRCFSAWLCLSPTNLQFVGQDHHSFVKIQIFVYFSVQKLEYWKRYSNLFWVAVKYLSGVQKCPELRCTIYAARWII